MKYRCRQIFCTLFLKEEKPIISLKSLETDISDKRLKILKGLEPLRQGAAAAETGGLRPTKTWCCTPLKMVNWRQDISVATDLSLFLC